MSQRAVDGEPQERPLAIGLVVGGLVGLVASAVLLIERIRLAEDSSYVPSCSINPVLSCGNVMESAQAALLGFPNPIIGVAAFPVVIATGMALLAGGRLARWYWLGLQVGVSVALVLVSWLVFQSLYRIGALCPYCMVVWAVVIPLFWYVTLRNLAAGVLGAGAAGSRATAVLRDWQAPLLFGAYLVVVLLILERFWYYWSTLF
ncbi:vitamin K epoxide reductase family protein [Nocardioides sp. zg-1308]|uniref:Vitamin K epoxide reductase family protein n=1 Tax=Nocardioides renjunii TaxID=3095075 RepID=A0ABU5K9D9_9ACTN|nr:MULTISPECIES: vitamin K epoxide reductase family protein [unclassified Nocardioides]MDZ5661517.1 vitamin K epoxide reductase family protein [Nocardioides sp. S-58]NPD04624.1 vitamin K epoxide reductase family protein [Nocardioides sp. zg-1308]